MADVTPTKANSSSQLAAPVSYDSGEDGEHDDSTSGSVSVGLEVGSDGRFRSSSSKAHSRNDSGADNAAGNGGIGRGNFDYLDGNDALRESRHRLASMRALTSSKHSSRRSDSAHSADYSDFGIGADYGIDGELDKSSGRSSGRNSLSRSSSRKSSTVSESELRKSGDTAAAGAAAGIGVLTASASQRMVMSGYGGAAAASGNDRRSLFTNGGKKDEVDSIDADIADALAAGRQRLEDGGDPYDSAGYDTYSLGGELSVDVSKILDDDESNLGGGAAGSRRRGTDPNTPERININIVSDDDTDTDIGGATDGSLFDGASLGEGTERSLMDYTAEGQSLDYTAGSSQYPGAGATASAMTGTQYSLAMSSAMGDTSSRLAMGNRSASMETTERHDNSAVLSKRNLTNHSSEDRMDMAGNVSGSGGGGNGNGGENGRGNDSAATKKAASGASSSRSSSRRPRGGGGGACPCLPGWISNATPRVKCLIGTAAALLVVAIVMIVVAVTVPMSNRSETNAAASANDGASVPMDPVTPADPTAYPTFSGDSSDDGGNEVTFPTDPTVVPTTIPPPSAEPTTQGPTTTSPTNVPSVLSPAPNATSTTAPTMTAVPTTGPTISASPTTAAPSSSPTVSASPTITSQPTVVMNETMQPTIEGDDRADDVEGNKTEIEISDGPTTTPTTSPAPTTNLDAKGGTVSFLVMAGPFRPRFRLDDRLERMGTVHDDLEGLDLTNDDNDNDNAPATEDGDGDGTPTEDGGGSNGGDAFLESSFLVHLGGFMAFDSRSQCEEEDYESVADKYSVSPMPAYFVMGTEDWVGCPDPEQAFEFWGSYVGRGASDTGAVGGTQVESTYDVIRDNPRGENWAFVLERVLYIGVNLVGVPEDGITDEDVLDDWPDRLNDEATFVANLYDEYIVTKGEAEAMVLFGHSPMGDDGPEENEQFWTVLAILLGGYFEGDDASAVPFLYVEPMEPPGDNSDYEDDRWELTDPVEVAAAGPVGGNGIKLRRLRVAPGVWPPVRVIMDTADNALTVDGGGWYGNWIEAASSTTTNGTAPAVDEDDVGGPPFEALTVRYIGGGPSSP